MGIDASRLGQGIVAIQAGQAALIGAILCVFVGRGWKDHPLRYWAWSWIALACYYAASLAPGTPMRLVRGASAFLGAAWLVQGAAAIMGRPVTRATRTVALFALLGAASAVIPHLTGLALDAFTGGWTTRCLVVGAAYIACAALVWRSGRAAGVGGILLPASFLLYGLKLYYYSFLAARDYGSGLSIFDSLGGLLNVSDVPLQAAMGLGTVVWLLEREHGRLKDADRLKSELLANVNHELRTPLTAIQGYTELMLAGGLGPVDESHKDVLEVMLRNERRLAGTIVELLDFSRLETGEVSIRPEPFSLPFLVERVVDGLGPEVARAGLSLAREGDAGLRPVVGDPSKLARVLENLLLNAIKFTPAGGRITVSMRLAGTANAEVSVSDSGIGIPEDQLDLIFDRFFQVDGSARRRFGGVGLGLSIVKSILDAHGAPIAVESRVGSGTTFRFTLPLQEGAAGGACAVPEAGTLDLPTKQSA